MAIRGGEVQGRVGLFDAAELVIRGAEVQESVGLFDRGQLLILGGKIADWVIASDSSRIALEEGDVSTFILYETAELVVRGKDFELDGSPQALGDLDVGSGTLTGVYDSGTAFSLYFERYDQSRIQLVAVPEPVSMLMQAMSLIVIAALRGRSMGRASS